MIIKLLLLDDILWHWHSTFRLLSGGHYGYELHIAEVHTYTFKTYVSIYILLCKSISADLCYVDYGPK